MNQPAGSDDGEQARLLNAVADDLLTPVQESRLVELLRADAHFRREYIRMCQLTTHLMWSAFVLDPPTIPSADTVFAPAVHREASSSRRWLTVSATSAVIVMLLVTGLVWRFFEPAEKPGPGFMTHVTGTVSVTCPNQRSLTLRAEDVRNSPWRLRAGDRIQTARAGSVVVALSDGTQFLIDASTEIVHEADLPSRWYVSRGQLSANVAPQSPSDPLVFLTPHASVHVLGTELELLVESEHSEVAVTEGKVRVTRNTDQNERDLTAGEMLVIEETGPLAVIPRPFLPEEWDADFEQGLPSGWTGRSVADGLPAGSRGAAQGIRSLDQSDSRTLLATPRVDQGLFRWHSDSVLQLTFRVQPPAWFHICLETRTPRQAVPRTTWCRVDPQLWQTQPGQWRTVRIPLSEFYPTGSVVPRTSLDRIPLRLSFVGPEDLPGVTIDSIRIERRPTHHPASRRTESLEKQP